MSNSKKLEQARFIAKTGRKLKDHIFSIQSGLHNGQPSGPKEELSMAQVQMLMALHASGGSTISSIAQQLKVSSPSASCMVDRLEDKGILYRERSSEDRRKVVVRLSSKAAAKAKQMETAVLAAFLELVEKVGPETAEKWCEVLERVDQVLSNPTTQKNF
jgi:DNA-binding MarR family transcriptional regulator